MILTTFFETLSPLPALNVSGDLWQMQRGDDERNFGQIVANSGYRAFRFRRSRTEDLQDHVRGNDGFSDWK